MISFGRYEIAYLFYDEGWIRISRGGLDGACDWNGKELIAPKYKHKLKLENGVFYTTDGKGNKVASTGVRYNKNNVPCQFNYITPIGGQNKSGLQQQYSQPQQQQQSQPQQQQQQQPQEQQQQTIRIERAPVPMQVWRQCYGCGGSGQCYICGGLGWRYMTSNNPQAQCITCGGNGRCNMCAGQGGHYEIEYR